MINVDAPDFEAMMEKLYHSITPAVEETRRLTCQEAEAWDAAASRTLRQSGQKPVFGGPGKKP